VVRTLRSCQPPRGARVGTGRSSKVGHEFLENGPLALAASKEIMSDSMTTSGSNKSDRPEGAQLA